MSPASGGPNVRRSGERVEILGDLQGEVMVFERMVVRQISAGGAQVETRFPLHLNSLHTFRWSLGELSVVVKGRVVHSRVSDIDQDVIAYLSGIEFVEPSLQVAEAIAGFVEAIRQNTP